MGDSRILPSQPGCVNAFSLSVIYPQIDGDESLIMCGIAGFIDPLGLDDAHRSVLSNQAAILRHRGPDDSGIWSDASAGVGLTHRRLAIIDLSPEGHQPMVSSSGRFVMVYNGEVYNYRELRHEIEHSGMGIVWRGQSDTEVVLAAIELWGLKRALQRFVGMFALAVWDRHQHILKLARDRIGIKPLYYGKAGRSFVFGSELKALRCHPAFVAEIDRKALERYLQYACIPAPRTIYHNARKLPAGHILAIPLRDSNAGNTMDRPQPYWSAAQVAARGQRNLLSMSERNAASQLETLLNDAVRLRMIADVPLGAFLSGGIDSSTVVALMQANSLRPVKTFTIGFHEADYNEAHHAAEVARHLGTDHNDLYVSHRKALDLIPQLPVVFCEPFADPSQIPTLLLSALTRDHVTVCLSGDGGDELFGGYNRHFRGEQLWRHLRRIPLKLRQSLATVLQAIPPSGWNQVYGLLPTRYLPPRLRMDFAGDRIYQLAAALKASGPKDMYRQWISRYDRPYEIIIDANDDTGADSWPPEFKCISSFTHEMMVADLMRYLPDDILVKLDRASMAFSLEARVPLLDHRVVEFAWQLPLQMKVANNQGKRILRRILHEHVPRHLVERPKSGFAVPLDSWLRGPLRDWAEDLLNPDRIKRDGLFNAAPIRRKWREHLSGRQNWQYRLWIILMFQAWLDQERQKI